VVSRTGRCKANTIFHSPFLAMREELRTGAADIAIILPSNTNASRTW